MRETIDLKVQPKSGSDYVIYHPASCGTKHAIRETVKDCLKRKFGYLEDLSIVVDSHGELVLFSFNCDIDQCGTPVHAYISGQATPDTLVVNRIKTTYLGNVFDLDVNLNCATLNFDVVAKALFTNLLDGRNQISLNAVPLDLLLLKGMFKQVTEHDDSWECAGTQLTTNQVIKKLIGREVDFNKGTDTYTVYKG